MPATTLPPRNPSAAALRLSGLEALRGIAAICVVLLHLQATFGGHPAIFGKGYLGVDFFLMLSGYLMARNQEARLAGGLSPWRFMGNRYRRLWPMMALGGLIGVPTLLMRTSDFGQFLMLAIPNFLLLPVSFQREAFPLNIPAWTIFYELVANALHVLLFWRLGMRGLMLAILACLPFVVWIGLDHGNFDVGARPEHFIWGLPRICFAYLIGMGLSRWWRDEPPLAVPPALAFIAMPALFIASWALGMRSWLFDLAFVTLACPLVLAGALRMTRRSRAAEWLGQLSFPLFAVHMSLLQIGRRMFDLSWPAGGALALGGGIIVAVLATQRKGRQAARKTA